MSPALTKTERLSTFGVTLTLFQRLGSGGKFPLRVTVCRRLLGEGLLGCSGLDV